MAVEKFTKDDLNKRAATFRSSAVVRCRFTRPHAGGQPATEKGLNAFVEHHLGLDPDSDDFKEALARITNEEIGEREDTPEEGELKEEKVYGVNVIRRNSSGPFILEHMVKAVCKVAASRLDYFVKKRGSKGDLSEMTVVRAHGASLKDEDRPWEITLTDKEGNPVGTHYELISGSISSPQGKKSIQHHTECTDEDCYFEFEYRWPAKKIKKNEILNIFSAIGDIGIGSTRSLNFSKFEVLEVELDIVKIEKEKKAAA
jgi:hypothetical protein